MFLLMVRCTRRTNKQRLHLRARGHFQRPQRLARCRLRTTLTVIVKKLGHELKVCYGQSLSKSFLIVSRKGLHLPPSTPCTNTEVVYLEVPLRGCRFFLFSRITCIFIIIFLISLFPDVKDSVLIFCVLWEKEYVNSWERNCCCNLTGDCRNNYYLINGWRNNRV